MKIPEKGFYYHYKHDPKADFNNYSYEVVGLARNTEDKTFSVLYRPLYKSDWFAPADLQSRPYEMFMGSVVLNGREEPRFIRITDSKLIERLKKIREDMYGI